MVLSAAPLPDIGHWARGSGLEIVLLLTGAILLTRFAAWLGGRITDRIDAGARETDAVVRSEASKHRHALASVITWVTLVVIYCVTGVAILARLGIPVTSLVAPAAVAAVALGLGPQRVVHVILARVFLITERQYGFEDLIRHSVASLAHPAIRNAQELTLPA